MLVSASSLMTIRLSFSETRRSLLPRTETSLFLLVRSCLHLSFSSPFIQFIFIVGVFVVASLPSSCVCQSGANTRGHTTIQGMIIDAFEMGIAANQVLGSLLISDSLFHNTSDTAVSVSNQNATLPNPPQTLVSLTNSQFQLNQLLDFDLTGHNLVATGNLCSGDPYPSQLSCSIANTCTFANNNGCGTGRSSSWRRSSSASFSTQALVDKILSSFPVRPPIDTLL
jgi:hypothetical protein